MNKIHYLIYVSLFLLSCSQERFHFTSLNRPASLSAIKNESASISMDNVCFLMNGKVHCHGQGRGQVPNLIEPTDLTGGDEHLCANTKTGVVCWNPKDQSILPSPSFEKTVIQLTAGNGHTCALDESQNVRCWGNNQYKQLEVPLLRSPKMISAALHRTCAVTDDGVSCWGQVPDQTPTLVNVQEITLGNHHSCAVVDHKVKCWGSNVLGQSLPPNDLENPTGISAGSYHTCASTNGSIRCWGKIETPPVFDRPQRTFSGGFMSCASTARGIKCWGTGVSRDLYDLNQSNLTQLSVSHYHACGLQNGKVVCWGSNLSKQLDIPPLVAPTNVVAAPAHTCAIDQGTVKCWGSSDLVYRTPKIHDVILLTSEAYYACAAQKHKIICWGNNSYGQTDSPLMNDIKKIVSNGDHVCALSETEGVRCWGRNTDGESNVPFLAGASDIAVGQGYSCAVTLEGVECWGNYPKIPTLNSVQSITSSLNHLCATTEEGVVCWGDAKGGKTFPPFIQNIQEISAGRDFTCASTKDWVYCWGGIPYY